MKWISCLLFLGFSPLAVQAAITNVGVAESGYSADDIIAGVNIIYGGIANGNEGPNLGTTFNNTCDVPTTEACNRANIGDNVELVFSFSYSGVKAGSKWKVEFDGDDVSDDSGFSTSAPSVPSGTATYTVTWGELCNDAFNTTSTGCGQTATARSFSEDLSIGITDGNTDNVAEGFSFTYNIKFRSAPTGDSTATACPNGENNPLGTLCDFEVYPGDRKIYFKKLEDKSNSLKFGTTCAPAAPVSGEKWYGVRVYFKPTSQGPITSDYSVLDTTAKDLQIRPIEYTCTNFTAGDDFAVEGLENGVEYQFAIATIDPTGNIEGYHNPGGARATGIPAPVEGLLEKQGCFIATAAYGSEWAPQVQVLREFRDQWLLKSSFGKYFVKQYYKYSPKIALWISDKPTVKALVRGFLGPVVWLIESVK